MSCKCQSYNRETGTVPEIIMKQSGTDKEICIDACIAEQIKELWVHNIYTQASCCGHNTQSPSVVIEDRHDSIRARDVLEKYDNRRWEIKTWLLTEVAVALPKDLR